MMAQVKFTSPLGNFKATFPGTPEYSNSDVDISDGTTKLHMFLFTSDAGHVYLSACANYPDSYLSSESDRNTFLENAVEGFFGELAIAPGNRVNVKSGKYKGLEYRGQNETYSVIYRVYIAKNTVFQIGILSNGGYIDAKSAKAFFKSFKITI
ncbi:MAG: hypothetical protein CVU11_07165 [Bacteroidetes bacterium HGW-Bacteroidetes-6]|nr:MAG: hypothetical protein CVU11_07165 [Bacteroidetes bacterium HGW-Bacteroidetes-6]